MDTLRDRLLAELAKDPGTLVLNQSHAGIGRLLDARMSDDEVLWKV